MDLAVKNTDVAMKMEHTAWGCAEDITLQDLVIPRLLLQQQMSPLVVDEKAKAGDWVETLEKRKLAGAKDKLEVVMFHVKRSHGIFLNKNGQNRHIRTEPIDPAAPYEEETAEGTIQRSVQWDFYCLPVKGIDEEIPMVLRLRRSSSDVAKRLMSAFAKAAKAGKSSANYVIELTHTKEKQRDGNGTFMKPDFVVGRATTKDELAAAYGWYQTVTAGKGVMVQEEEEDVTPADSIGGF